MQTEKLVKKVINRMSEEELKQTLIAVVDNYPNIAEQLKEAIVEDYKIGELNAKNNNDSRVLSSL